MNTTATYNDGNGTEVIFKKSLRNQMFYHHLRDVLAPDADQPDYGERIQYAFVAGYAQSVKGLVWKPPAFGDSAKNIEASYQAFLDAVPDYETFNALFSAANEMRRPLADPVQRPDEALTDEERADPN